MLVVIDAGNYSTKFIYEGEKVRAFPSISHPYEPIATDDIVNAEVGMNRVQYLGLDKWIGEDAKDFFAIKKEQEIYSGNVRKGHYDALLRVILALYKVWQETNQNDFELVVMSPVTARKNDKRFFEE